MEELKEVLINTVMITSFVIVIMLFIELVNILTQGNWSKWLGKNKMLQVVIAALLGLIPGCFGGFAAVGMWTHGIISFGALLAAMIASVGDEAFVMLVQMPKTAFLLFGILLVIAIAVGWIADRFNRCVRCPEQMEHHLILHSHEQPDVSHLFAGWRRNFRNLSFTRVLLLTGLGLFILGMLTGVFEHDHTTKAITGTDFHLLLDESWFNGLFVVLAILIFLVFVFVDDHFLEEHLWKHILRQHVPKIFLWTLGALILIHFTMNSVVATEWMAQNQILVLVLAVLIGFIPESGPHLMFITLFLSGQIPFSILLANSITQDGHSTLPLLAESKRGFVAVKLINGLVGLLFGLIGYITGF
jgi:hypothetical protein